MDPISLIMTALVAGAATALKDTAGDAIKDAYAGLKSLLKRKLGGDAIGEAAIERLEREPATWEKPVEAELVKVDAGGDEQIIEAARAVLRITDPEGMQGGKYTVQVSGGQGTVIGDHSTVTQTFDNSP